MTRINPKPTKKLCELHECMRHAMRLCRWAGYFSVTGLDQLSTENIRFHFVSIYGIYNIATIVGQLVMCYFSLLWLCNGIVTLTSLSIVVFYVTGIISAILFVKLAQRWPKLIKTAEEAEKGINIKTKSAAQKTRFIAYIYMTLALVEHVLCANFNAKFVVECIQENDRFNNLIEDYITYTMPFVFNYVSYNAFRAILVQILGMQATFIWSFCDVMTICFSIYITSYFQNLNKMINSKKTNNRMTWGQLREYYSKIVVLVKEIDAQLSSFILLSFFTDLFFICLQLFKSLHRNNGIFIDCNIEERRNMISSPDYLLYYLYSFLFLLLRTLSLSLFAANVHAAAQEPMVALYDVPPSDYDMQLQRFQSQLRFTDVALTGKFFTITRNMVVQVIGTIITYELVLLQFSIAPETTNWSTPVVDNSSAVNNSQF